MKRVCDENCNECPLMLHPNSRMVTKILNEAHDKFGNEFYHIVQSNCPNLTCCYDCHIDDFCHMDGCELVKGDTLGSGSTVDEAWEMAFDNILENKEVMK